MASIFISHSSQNNEEAIRVRNWLEEQGFSRSQVFLDIDDLRTGDRWRDVLNSMAQAEAVIACISDEWLNSDECKREFNFAERDGKPIFPLRIKPVNAPIPRYISDLQIGDISAEGLAKLRYQLLTKRIAPESFPWPPKDEADRSVFRGLEALQIQDAAIFFGRDTMISKGMDELRRLRDGARERVLVILGASGAGKSSFLRAGLLARLLRDEANFLPLSVLLPERTELSATTGLEAILSSALDREVTVRGSKDLVAAFQDLRALALLRVQQSVSSAGELRPILPPTIVIPIDQAEKLFGSANLAGADLARWLEEALLIDGNTIVVAAIRSDEYESFQNALLPDRQSLLTLPPVPVGKLDSIISGPAALADPPMEIQPELISKLLHDLGESDALPLLAYTLAQLVDLAKQRSYRNRRVTLKIDDYVASGGVRRILSDATESATKAGLSGIPSANADDLVRQIILYKLCEVSTSGSPQRKSALWSDFDDTAQSFLQPFIEARLVIKTQDDRLKAPIVELAHESILRNWDRLSELVLAEKQVLLSASLASRESQVWADNNRDGNFLSLAPVHLLRLRGAIKNQSGLILEKRAHEYLLACIAKDQGAISAHDNAERAARHSGLRRVQRTNMYWTKEGYRSVKWDEEEVALKREDVDALERDVRYRGLLTKEALGAFEVAKRRYTATYWRVVKKWFAGLRAASFFIAGTSVVVGIFALFFSVANNLLSGRPALSDFAFFFLGPSILTSVIVGILSYGIVEEEIKKVRRGE